MTLIENTFIDQGKNYIMGVLVKLLHENFTLLTLHVLRGLRVSNIYLKLGIGLVLPFLGTSKLDSETVLSHYYTHSSLWCHMVIVVSYLYGHCGVIAVWPLWCDLCMAIVV